jgi:hypothetical protein
VDDVAESGLTVAETPEDDVLGAALPDLAVDPTAEAAQWVATPAGGEVGDVAGDLPSVTGGVSRSRAGQRVTQQAEKAGFGAVRDEQPVDESRSRTVAGLAYQGRPARLPVKPSAAFSRISEIDGWLDRYQPFQRDFNDLAAINAEIASVARGLTEVERLYGLVAGHERDLAVQYDMAKNRALVDVSGGSEKSRVAYAEVMVEQIRFELEETRLQMMRADRASRLIRSHLDALTVIANNVRATIRVV